MMLAWMMVGSVVTSALLYAAATAVLETMREGSQLARGASLVPGRRRSYAP